MNKNDLVAKVADSSGLSRTDATKAVDSLFDCITDELNRVVTFVLLVLVRSVSQPRAASVGRNPRTNETIKIAASKQPKFKAGKGLKDAVN